MTEFVGRTGSLRLYSYPETRRGGAAVSYARNYATGTKGGSLIGPAGREITWNAIDVGSDPSIDVPITPLSTGVVLVSGVATLLNGTGAPILVTIRVHVDDVAVGAPFAATTVPAGGEMAIPFLAETDVLSLSAHFIQIFVDGDGANLIADGSAVNVQEVPVSTG